MSNTLNNSTGKTGKRQWLVVAAILVITLIAGALILRGNSAPVQGGHAEADSHASHAEEASHGSHDEKGAPQESHAGEEAAKGPNGGQALH